MTTYGRYILVFVALSCGAFVLGHPYIGGFLAYLAVATLGIGMAVVCTSDRGPKP